MKRITALLLCLCLVFSLCACGGGGGDDEPDQPGNPVVTPDDGGNGKGTDGEDPRTDIVVDPIIFDYMKTEKGARVYMSRLPSSVKDLENADLSNEYVAAALIVAVLCHYEVDPDTCFEMLDYMMGPEDISAFDKSFIKNQFDQYPYVARSYMIGATPKNGYETETVGFEMTENSYSRQEDGYVKIFFQSGGADSQRGMTVRHKASTNQWFLFSDTYKGLLAGIRAPESDDKWN